MRLHGNGIERISGLVGRVRFADGGAGSDHADRSSHGRLRVRAGDSSGTSTRRLGAGTPERPTPGPAANRSATMLTGGSWPHHPLVFTLIMICSHQGLPIEYDPIM